MAQLHILTGDGNRNYQCVLHVPVPNGNNTAGTPWRTAIVASGLGGSTQLADGDGTGGTISAAEKAQIASGALHEVTFIFQDDINFTPAQRNAALDQQIAALTAETQARVASVLRVFGLTRG